MLVLAQLRGWNVLRDAAAWYFSRPMPDTEYGVEGRYAESNEEALRVLTEKE